MLGSIKQPIRFVLLTPDSMQNNPVNAETRYKKKPTSPEKIKIIIDNKIRIEIESLL